MLPYDILRVSDRIEKPYPMIHPNTGKPFTGWAYQAFAYGNGKSTTKHMPFEHGLKDGVEIFFNERGVLLRKTHLKKNLLHGPNDSFYENGMPREKSVYEIKDSTRSRLLSMRIWKPDGRRCPHSGIDSTGTGECWEYDPLNGEPYSMIFYDRFEINAEVFFAANGEADEVWAHRGIKREKSIWKVL